MAKFEESNICPICGGRLIASPEVLASYPPQHKATCEKCGKVFYSHHVIGFVDEGPKIPDGMWCDYEDDDLIKTDKKIVGFVHEDTFNPNTGPNNYYVYDDGTKKLLDDKKGQK